MPSTAGDAVTNATGKVCGARGKVCGAGGKVDGAGGGGPPGNRQGASGAGAAAVTPWIGGPRGGAVVGAANPGPYVPGANAPKATLVTPMSTPTPATMLGLAGRMSGAITAMLGLAVAEKSTAMAATAILGLAGIAGLPGPLAHGGGTGAGGEASAI